MLGVGNIRSLDDPAPVPLSFPSILRNPGIKSRYAFLSDSTADKPKLTSPKKHKTLRRDDNEGKRWIRRKENARFSGNTHVVSPGKRDYLPQVPQIPSTFPEPLPVYLARNSKLPTARLPTADPRNSDYGRFSVGLKGMRRDLRKMRWRSEPLIADIESELLGWLEVGGTLLSPDGPESTGSPAGTPIGSTGTVIELSRTPLQLIWRMTDDSDAFARYVVHCTARYHKVVSFSKEVSGQRLTYLLRPNVNYPGYHAALGVDTPPATDIDLSSQLDTESEFASDRDTRSEAGDSVADSIVDHMSTIDEDFVSSPHLPPASDFIDDWSDVGDDRGESENEAGMGESIDSLGGVGDETMRVERSLAQLSLRARSSTFAAHTRSTSSPSRSPVRPARRTVIIPSSSRQIVPPKSFYEYLFS